MFLGIDILVFWFWFKTAPFIAAGEFQNYWSFLIPLAGLVLAASFFTLMAVFVENPLLIFGTAFLGSGIPYFFVQANTTIIILFLGSLFLSFSAVYRVRQEFNLSLGFNLSRIAKSGLPIYFTISSLIISVFYFVNIKEEKNISAILPKPALSFALKKLSGPLESLSGLPDLNPDATIDEVLFKLAEKQLTEQGINLSKFPRKDMLQVIASQRQEFAKNLGIELDGQEKVGDVFYRAVSQRIENLLGPYKEYLPVASAVAFFLAFKTLTFPLYYLAFICVYFLIKIMIAVKLLTKELKKIEVQKITL